MKKKLIRRTSIMLATFLAFATSCNLVDKSVKKEAVARVNDSYLYKEDIAGLVSDQTSEEDSVLIVSNYIKRWATQQLLIDRAKVNIPLEKQKEFDKLVQNYKNQLYANAYTDVIITRQLDTAVSLGEAREYFEKNGENFKLNEDLVKLRYINLTKSNHDIESIKEHFKNFDKTDKKALMDMAIQFKSYSFNDSVWVRTKEVYDKITLLTAENRSELLNKQSFLQLEDSLEVYLIAVEDVRERGEQAPLEYIMPTIEQILLNKQKLELIKKLERDITKDAIKNEKFEIYN